MKTPFCRDLQYSYSKNIGLCKLGQLDVWYIFIDNEREDKSLASLSICTALQETLNEVARGSDEYSRKASGILTLMQFKLHTSFGFNLAKLVFGATELLLCPLVSKPSQLHVKTHRGRLTSAYIFLKMHWRIFSGPRDHGQRNGRRRLRWASYAKIPL